MAEYRLRWPGSDARHYRLCVERLADASESAGAPSRVVVNFVDINETHGLRRRLAIARAELSALCEAVPYMLIVLGPDGSVLQANQRALNELEGLRESSRVDLASLMELGQCGEHALRGLQCALQGESFDFETRMRRRDGRAAAVLVRLRPLMSTEQEHRGRRALALICERAEGKYFEARVARGLEKLGALSAVVGGVANDFNNLLTGILGAISLTLADTGLREPARELLGSARVSALRARDLARRLRSFADGSAATSNVYLEPVLRRAMSALQQRSGWRIELECPDGLWPLDGEPDQIEEMVERLIRALADRYAAGGRMTISCANCRHPSDSLRAQHEPAVRVQIELSPNEELSASGKAPSKNAEMAMKIVKAIVAGHEGEISRIEGSDCGRGLCIVLPAVLEPTARARGSGAMARPQRTAR